MILRVFRAHTKPGMRAAFEQLCYEKSVPQMRAQPGLVAIHVGTPTAQRPTEFVLVSVWKDLEGLQAFTGPDWENVVTFTGEADLVEDVSVQHYDEAFQDLTKIRSLMADILRRKEAAITQAFHISDAQWEQIKPLMPTMKREGRPRADDRRILEGILYIVSTGCRWHDLPREYGSPATCWRRLAQWEASGAWERILETLSATLDTQGLRAWAHFSQTTALLPAKRRRRSQANVPFAEAGV